MTSHPELVQNLSIKGTPIYMAPEIPELKEGNSKVDVFSLGVVVYRLAFRGEYPFFDQGRKYRSINEYFRELKVKKMVIPEHHDRSPELIDLIKRMLDKDHNTRISWK
jgi:serine/threonine protein kinase